MHPLTVGRVGDPVAAGTWRVLVDRLWPRGVKKAAAPSDEWAKDLAPSTELRKWNGHDPDRYPEFQRRYRAELLSRPAEVERILASLARRPVALLTATKHIELSQVPVLRDFMAERMP